jgi:hypothetical protein
MDQTEQFFTNGRHLGEEGIALYVDALKLERTSELQEKILRHVRGCQRCKLEIIGLCDLLREEDYSRLGPHPLFDRGARGEAKRRIPIYRIAAGFAIVLALGGVIRLVSYLTGTRESSGAPANQSHAVALDTGAVKNAPEQPTRVRRPLLRSEVLAARFAEYPDLEGLVGAERRSAGVRILSPSIGQTVQGEVNFRWESGFKPPYTLTVLSNRGVVRKEVTLADSHYMLKTPLKEGLYYWKLVAAEELLCVGKFVVKSQDLQP